MQLQLKRRREAQHEKKRAEKTKREKRINKSAIMRTPYELSINKLHKTVQNIEKVAREAGAARDFMMLREPA